MPLATGRGNICGKRERGVWEPGHSSAPGARPFGEPRQEKQMRAHGAHRESTACCQQWDFW